MFFPKLHLARTFGTQFLCTVTTVYFQAEVIHFIADINGQRYSRQDIEKLFSEKSGIVINTASLGMLRQDFREEMISLTLGQDNLNVKVNY